MPRAIRSSDPTEPLGPIPKEYAAIMWPELPSLLEEINTEIVRTIPEYADIMAGPYGRIMRTGMEQSINIFVDHIAAPATPSPLRDEICRAFGRSAAVQGRTLETLQAAYRIGARVALRRAKKVGKRYKLSPLVMLAFADALFGYMDELEALSREGYLQAKAEADEDLDELRRKLVRLLLTGRTAPRSALADLSERTGWRRPEEISLVALGPDAKPSATALDGDVLVDLNDSQPCLVVPGPLDGSRRDMLSTALAGTRAAAGPAVPASGAADSLRWARQALGLACLGIIEDQPVVYCDDHLMTLWLLSDPALLELLAQRELAPLAGSTPARRERLVETLRTWLATRGTAAQMGELLHIHPQTVRYRMRNLDAAFGEQLGDPDRRFATEAVLRALHLREQAAIPEADSVL